MKTPASILVLISGAAALLACEPPNSAKSAGKLNVADPAHIELSTAGTDDLAVSGPYSHMNLDLYLVHGPERGGELELVTLAEAIESGDVVVHETEEVNELRISNQSKTKHVFIHSGDIVKGGKQDRTLPNSLVLAPDSAPTPVASFCVEQSRWAQRGAEQLDEFALSSKSLNTKDLKLAARLEKSQGKVWKKVDESQEKLSRNVYPNQEGSVRSGVSETSLQLALENEDLAAETKSYVEAIEAAAASRNEAIGYAFAVNGEFNSADIYLTRDLFQKMWPKRLEAAAYEAISEADAGDEFGRPVSGAILEAVRQADAAAPATEQLAGSNHVSVRETDKTVRFDACYQESGQPLVVHENVIAK